MESLRRDVEKFDKVPEGIIEQSVRTIPSFLHDSLGKDVLAMLKDKGGMKLLAMGMRAPAHLDW